VRETQSVSAGTADQGILYADAIDQYGAALDRLVRAYEADPEKRRDLGQDIHFQLWRSFSDMTPAVHCGLGFIVSPTMWARRTSFMNAGYFHVS
jgi:hypothetical protein